MSQDSKFKTSKNAFNNRGKTINIHSINTYQFKSKIDKIKSNLLNLLKILNKKRKQFMAMNLPLQKEMFYSSTLILIKGIWIVYQTEIQKKITVIPQVQISKF